MVVRVPKLRRYKNSAKIRVPCFGEKITGTNTTIPKNSWVRVPVKIFSADQKRRKIEEQRQDHSRSSWRGDNRNIGYNPEKGRWVLVCALKTNDRRT
jgi:hypothetical protein